MPKNGIGQSFDVVPSHMKPAVHDSSCLGGQNDLLAGSRTGTPIDHFFHPGR